MCGIIGYCGNNNSIDILINGLKKLEYRGYDSAGIGTIYNNNFYVVKDLGKVENLERKLINNNVFSEIGIGHTRWATHGKPNILNAHPHLSMNKKIMLVHNGIIENYQEIKNNLIKKNYKFITDTDSEVIANLLQDNYHGIILEAIQNSMKILKGSYALGIIFLDEPNNIYITKKESPLIVGIKDNEKYIASDYHAFLNDAKEIIYLCDNEIGKVNKYSIEFYDKNLNKIKKESLIINEKTIENINTYSSYLEKEIYEEPIVFKKTLENYIVNNYISFSNCNLSNSFLSSITKIIIVGCGSAYNAGLIGKGFIEQIARIPTDVILASEFRYSNPILSRNNLVIIISQSGETADSLAALKYAQSKGIYVLSIVNVKNSTIARLSDFTIYTYAGQEISVATTKAYLCQLGILYLLGIQLGFINNRLIDKEYSYYLTSLLDIPNKIYTVLNNHDEIKLLASKIYKTKSILFIGRTIDYYTIIEASLKLKELSYIHSEAIASGELKHGTISLIDENLPVISLSTQKDLESKINSNIEEIKSRNGIIYQIGFTNCDYNIPPINQEFSPMISIIPFQLLALYTCQYKKLDIDKPRNLAKSVTVE